MKILLRCKYPLLTFVACIPYLAAGQATQPTGPSRTSQTANSSSSPTLQVHNPRYAIQNQDVLKLTFPLTPELDQTVTVQPDGYINLQGAPSIHVQGLTVPEIGTAVSNAYASILKNPVITVDLKDFQKPQFTISGQVGKPGQYDLRADLTVTEAIAVAGGLAPTSTSHAFLFRRAPGGFNVEKIDLKPVLNGKDLHENETLRPGDMILVPENGITKFRKYVPYSIGANYFSSTI